MYEYLVFSYEQILYTWMKCTRMSVNAALINFVCSFTHVFSNMLVHRVDPPPPTLCLFSPHSHTHAARRAEPSALCNIRPVLNLCTEYCVLARLACIVFHSWGLCLRLERSLRVGCGALAIVSKSCVIAYQYHLPAPTSVRMSNIRLRLWLEFWAPLNWVYLLSWRESRDRPRFRYL